MGRIHHLTDIGIRDLSSPTMRTDSPLAERANPFVAFLAYGRSDCTISCVVAASAKPTPETRPLLRWVCGKRRLVPQLRASSGNVMEPMSTSMDKLCLR
jgi:hypothetical protein